jgi:2,3-bisphosphoglycerate-dependent phosphoglycerate mutase
MRATRTAGARRPGDRTVRTLTLLRHGESLWNRDKRFTGWTDVGLTPRGVAEARRAGELLAANGFAFDACYTSWLQRAAETLRLALEAMDGVEVPVHASWRLNERHYGALQGLSRWEAVRTYGARQMLIWQREFAARPPALEPADQRCPQHDPRYAALRDVELPRTESLADTLARVLPLWRDAIVPDLQVGRRVLVVAHHNTLRALVKHLDGIADADVIGVRIPTARPLVYELDEALRPVRHYPVKRAPRRWGWAAAIGR